MAWAYTVHLLPHGCGAQRACRPSSPRLPAPSLVREPPRLTVPRQDSDVLGDGTVTRRFENRWVSQNEQAG